MDLYKDYSLLATSILNISDEEYSDMLANFAKEAEEQKTCWVLYSVIAQRK